MNLPSFRRIKFSAYHPFLISKYILHVLNTLFKAFVAGFQLPEFKVKVENKLDMKDNWKDKPHEVFDLVHDAAVDWCTVEWRSNEPHENG